MKKGKLSTIILAIFFIALGAVMLLGNILGGQIFTYIVGGAAIAAGILMFIQEKSLVKKLGWLLLAIFLIVFGVFKLEVLNFSFFTYIVGGLGIASGVILLFTTKKVFKHLGLLLTACAAIAIGLSAFEPAIGIVAGIIAAVAGVLLLLGK